MPKLVRTPPKYRHNKTTGRAVVTINGKDRYLGKYGSKESRAEYARIIAEWEASSCQLPSDSPPDLIVTELVAQYWQFAQGYYVKNGEPTKTLAAIKAALRYLRQTHGHTLAVDFGPKALKAVRHQMVKADLSRPYINSAIGKITRVFKWAVAEELLPASVHDALAKVEGLRKGRTQAREPEPIGPVSDEVVDATLPYLPPVAADMVRFHRLVGARPTEVCLIRPVDLDRTGEVWCYTPESHKTEHHDRQRKIFIGPKAQEILLPYLLRNEEAYCFSPRDSERKRLTGRHEARKTPLEYGNRPGTNRKRKPKRRAGEHYNKDSYNRAIRRAVDKANKDRDDKDKLPYWRPNQLRHAVATTLRKQFGIEAAQTVLGHADLNVTEIYAERDFGLAREIMKKIG
jgi:integrase